MITSMTNHYTSSYKADNTQGNYIINIACRHPNYSLAVFLLATVVEKKEMYFNIDFFRGVEKNTITRKISVLLRNEMPQIGSQILIFH